MKSIDIESMFTILYVHVDDWYKEFGFLLKSEKRGSPASFSDSEIMTLLLSTEFLPFQSESLFLKFIKYNYLELFPNLLNQSEFNRRSRSLGSMIEELRKSIMRKMVQEFPAYVLIDTKPIPVIGYKRDKRSSDFSGSADYGYCASKKMKYFGYKLVAVTTISGFLLFYDIVPASTDERASVEGILSQLPSCYVIGDKGFIGVDWQNKMFQRLGHTLLTPKRDNQEVQLPHTFEKKLNSIRERVEGFFNEIQNVGRNIEHLFAKKIEGLSSRIIVKMTSYTFKHYLRLIYGIDLLNFQAEEYADI